MQAQHCGDFETTGWTENHGGSEPRTMAHEIPFFRFDTLDQNLLDLLGATLSVEPDPGEIGMSRLK